MPEMAGPPKVPLIAAPTPLHRLPRASDDLGIDLWIKRDDLTGFAGGGNKGRKLEYLIADALANDIEVIVSGGSTQSNFLRQLACACMIYGIHCAGATMLRPFPERTGRPEGRSVAEGGNRVLDEMFGLEMRVFPDGTWEEMDEHAEAIAEEYRAQGKKVLRLRNGGSVPLGAYGYLVAGEEAVEQADASFNFAITPSSSGGTHAGLGYFYHGSVTKLVGIACDPENGQYERLIELAAGLDEITGSKKTMTEDDFDVRFGYYGPGYGVPGEQGDAALDYLMRTEGVLLDPIYSGKTFAGLLDMVRSGEVGGRVLFWHTGGLPTLFAGG